MALTLKNFVFIYLAMYLVSCFYHKVHDFFTYQPHYKVRRDTDVYESTVQFKHMFLLNDSETLMHIFTFLFVLKATYDRVTKSNETNLQL